MSKTAVIYYSKYGTTRRYAEWIASELEAELFDARKFKKKDLSRFDTIVYGGGIYAGGIKGIELITKNWYKGLSEKRVIVFAVGITVESEACREQCLEVNFEKRFVTDAAEDAGRDSGQFALGELLKEKRMPIRCFFLPGFLCQVLPSAGHLMLSFFLFKVSYSVCSISDSAKIIQKNLAECKGEQAGSRIQDVPVPDSIPAQTAVLSRKIDQRYDRQQIPALNAFYISGSLCRKGDQHG